MAEEKINIDSEKQYHNVTKVLSKQSQPPAILRLLMRAMEGYRSARKYGWSRPWNKYDLVNFQSFKLRFPEDKFLLEMASAILAEECTDMPAQAKEFVADLLNDQENLMGFVFVHEYTENGHKYEGATLSLGRKTQRRYRDRLDLILESPVAAGLSQGFQRMRVFIDPYDNARKEPLWKIELRDAFCQPCHRLFVAMSSFSWEWEQDEDRKWDHWTSRYIEYFGERQWPMQKSYFFVTEQPQARLTDFSSSPVPDKTAKAC